AVVSFHRLDHDRQRDGRTFTAVVDEGDNQDFRVFVGGVGGEPRVRGPVAGTAQAERTRNLVAVFGGAGLAGNIDVRQVRGHTRAVRDRKALPLLDDIGVLGAGEWRLVVAVKAQWAAEAVVEAVVHRQVDGVFAPLNFKVI